MKPLTRIIVLSIVAVLLVAVIFVGIKVWDRGVFSLNLGIRSSYFYNDSEKYTLGGAELTGELTDLDINWVSGSVNIVAGDGDKIIISETSSNGDIEDNYKLRYLFEDGKLTIKYQKSGLIKRIFDDSQKALVLTIPAAYLDSMDDVEIDVVSANLNIGTIKCSTMNIDNVSGLITAADISGDRADFCSVSGEIKVETLNFSKINIKTVSSDISIKDSSVSDKLTVDTTSGKIIVNTSNVNYFDCDTISGEINCNFTNCPVEMDIESISGNVDVEIPDNDGFALTFDSASGDININGFATTKESDKYIYKIKDAEFDFETISGDFSLSLVN